MYSTLYRNPQAVFFREVGDFEVGRTVVNDNVLLVGQRLVSCPRAITSTRVATNVLLAVDNVSRPITAVANRRMVGIDLVLRTVACNPQVRASVATRAP